MNNKVLKILLFLGFIVVSIYFLYQSSPPYYYQAKLNFVLSEDELGHLEKSLKNNKAIKRIDLVGEGMMNIEYRKGETIEKISKKKMKEYVNLLSEAGVSSAWKIDGGILFYIGADYKFGKNFQISYILLNEVSGNEPSCDDSLKIKNRGMCFVRLDNNWFLNYEWVGI